MPRVTPVRSDTPLSVHVTRVAVALTLAWGVFAFGATYRWASEPLAAACLSCGVLAWWAARRIEAAVPLLSIALVAAAILVQLCPLPAAVVAAVSPNLLGAVSQLDAFYAVNGGPHALSLQPSDGWHALGLFVSFGMLLLGLSRFLSLAGTRWLLWVVTATSVLLAVFGIGQKALGDGIHIYGFWTPKMPGTPFGPFVNRNHFAGWMVMALPLTIGLVSMGLARGFRGLKPSLRDRLLWLGTPSGARVLLALFAATVMAVALMLTMSRSGMASLALALLMSGGMVLAGARGRGGRSLLWAVPIAIVVLAVAWAGIDAVVARFAETSWTEFDMRRGAWADARDIASRFIVTGTGLNTYGTATLLFQRHDLAQHYAQAHNDYLQLWAEGGLLLATPAAIFAVAVAAAIRRRFQEDDRSSSAWWARAGAVTGLIAILLQECFDFSLQMPGNAALFVVLCAIALHRPLRPAARSL
ncbi:MAG TPA: O-antigen ligase family protein [Vicinamibacterales bacterium]|nr:O-antigen ligase family protein [Vicinamibacterales bacterium]